MAPADVVDDVDGALATLIHIGSSKLEKLIVIIVNMDNEDDADQEQRLINEGRQS